MIVERPLKTAGTRRYTDEVAAGAEWVREQELDGDLDTIYTALNSSINQPIADGTITTAKLANGAATMPKLGVTYGRVRGSATVADRIVVPTTLLAVCTLAFTSVAGGLCFAGGALNFEFDGSNQAAAVAEIQLVLDGVETETQSTPFTAIGTPFVVSLALQSILRPAIGPHTIEYRARNAGAAGTTVTVLPSLLTIRELE